MTEFIKLTNVSQVKKTMIVNTDEIVMFQKGDREHTYLKLKDGAYFFSALAIQIG